jgi:O-antigen/teichoic acid export membrane protein
MSAAVSTNVEEQPSLAEVTGHAPRLRARALRGSAWVFASYLVGNVLRFASNLVLARVLFPEAFALTALAGILLQALQMFSDIGIQPAIVQSARGNEPTFLNTAWTIQAIRGVILWLATVALAWPVAGFYTAPELLWVVPVCGLSLITTGLQSTALHIKARGIDLRTITLLRLGETLVKTIITVTWALIHPSVWAMVGGSLISYTLFMIATHTLLPGPRNRFAWDRDAARELTRFGRWVFASTVVTFLAMQSDRLILGKIASLGVLGVYSIAYMLSKVPLDIGTRLAAQVQFPALAEVFRREPERLGARLVESRRVILGVSQFGVVGIIICSPWFFRLLYRSQFGDAAAFAPLLAGAMWFAILQATADRALLAVGDARSLAMSNGTNFCATLVGCVLGYKIAGMSGFIAGYGFGNLAGHAVVVIRLSRHGLTIIRQDFYFTLVVLVVALFAMLIPEILPGIFGRPMARIVIGAIGLTASGMCMLKSVRTVWEEPMQRFLARTLGRRRVAWTPGDGGPQ